MSEINQLEEVNCFENFVFAGGGSKAFAYIGVFKYIEEHKLKNNLKKVIGSSAGALVAMILSLKLSYEESRNAMVELSLNEITNNNFGLIGEGTRFVKNYGYYDGSKLEVSIGKLLLRYCDDENIDLKRLYDLTGIDLIVTITCVEHGETWYCNHETEPNLEVKKAIRMSMSYPWVFDSVKYKGLHFCDGGLYNNFPIDYWDDDSNKTKNSMTLGFLLMTDNEYLGKKEEYDTNDIIKYSIAIIKGSVDKLSKDHYEQELNEKKSRIVKINIGNISSLDTELSNENIVKLIQSGYNACVNYFGKGNLDPVIELQIPDKKLNLISRFKEKFWKIFE